MDWEQIGTVIFFSLFTIILITYMILYYIQIIKSYPNLFHWNKKVYFWIVISNKITIMNILKGILSNLWIDGAPECHSCPFIYILSRFYPDSIQILSRFYPNFWKNLGKIRINLDKIGKNTLSRFYPDFIQIFSKIGIKSG